MDLPPKAPIAVLDKIDPFQTIPVHPLVRTGDWASFYPWEHGREACTPTDIVVTRDSQAVSSTRFASSNLGTHIALGGPDGPVRVAYGVVTIIQTEGDPSFCFYQMRRKGVSGIYNAQRPEGFDYWLDSTAKTALSGRAQADRIRNSWDGIAFGNPRGETYWPGHPLLYKVYDQSQNIGWIYWYDSPGREFDSRQWGELVRSQSVIDVTFGIEVNARGSDGGNSLSLDWSAGFRAQAIQHLPHAAINPLSIEGMHSSTPGSMSDGTHSVWVSR